MDKREILQNCHLYGIIDTGYVAAEQLPEITRRLLAGGIRILQLRAKNCTPEQIYRFGAALLPLCRERHCLFIINDYPHIAQKLSTDGVHLGQDDGSIQAARDLLGPQALIGRSTHSVEQALAAYAEQADYIGFGPLFPTGTKPGRPAIGLQHIKTVQTQLPGHYPMFCIGGINNNTLKQVLHAGAERVVIVSWLLNHPDITHTVCSLRKQTGER